MNVRDAVDLFKREMMNEVYHSAADEDLQNSLIDAVKRVEEIVIATYKAEQRPK